MIRGKLKIFLGYAQGVGKSEALLRAALKQRDAGRQVLLAGWEAPELPSVPAGRMGESTWTRACSCDHNCCW